MPGRDIAWSSSAGTDEVSLLPAGTGASANAHRAKPAADDVAARGDVEGSSLAIGAAPRDVVDPVAASAPVPTPIVSNPARTNELKPLIREGIHPLD